MNGQILAAFSQLKKPFLKWTSFLKSACIESVFLTPQNCQSNLFNILKKEGLKVFLEMGTFAHDPLLWQKFPEARVLGRDGKPFYGKPLCPTNERIRKITLKKIDQLTSCFSFEAVFLDGLRFPGVWEKKTPDQIPSCFCPNCLKKFADEHDLHPPKNSERDWPLRSFPKKWINWRVGKLVTFLKKAKKIIKKNSPETHLGVFIIPFKKKEFAGAVVKIYGQDFQAFSREADILSPMLYHRLCGRKLSWINAQVKYFKKLTQKPILPAIQTTDLPPSINKMTVKELKKAIKLATSSLSRGVILFTLDNAFLVFDTDKVLKILHEVHSRSDPS